jgi:hypothetical protein
MKKGGENNGYQISIISKAMAKSVSINNGINNVSGNGVINGESQ